MDPDVAEPDADTAPLAGPPPPAPLAPDPPVVVWETGPVEPEAPPGPLEALLLDVGLADTAPVVPPAADEPVTELPVAPEVEFPVAPAVEPPLEPPFDPAVAGPVEPLVSVAFTI